MEAINNLGHTIYRREKATSSRMQNFAMICHKKHCVSEEMKVCKKKNNNNNINCEFELFSFFLYVVHSAMSHQGSSVLFTSIFTSLFRISVLMNTVWKIWTWHP